MTQAVTKIVAINASRPAAIGFGVHWFSMLDPKTERNVMICNSFIMGECYAL